MTEAVKQVLELNEAKAHSQSDWSYDVSSCVCGKYQFCVCFIPCVLTEDIIIIKKNYYPLGLGLLSVNRPTGWPIFSLGSILKVRDRLIDDCPVTDGSSFHYHWVQRREAAAAAAAAAAAEGWGRSA